MNIETIALLSCVALGFIALLHSITIREMKFQEQMDSERIRRYRMAVDLVDKWCSHESTEASLVAKYIDAVGEGRGMNGGTPNKLDVCDIQGTREQLRRLKVGK